jgi:hypothetical protein
MTRDCLVAANRHQRRRHDPFEMLEQQKPAHCRSTCCSMATRASLTSLSRYYALGRLPRGPDRFPIPPCRARSVPSFLPSSALLVQPGRGRPAHSEGQSIFSAGIGCFPTSALRSASPPGTSSGSDADSRHPRTSDSGSTRERRIDRRSGGVRHRRTRARRRFTSAIAR